MLTRNNTFVKVLILQARKTNEIAQQTHAKFNNHTIQFKSRFIQTSTPFKINLIALILTNSTLYPSKWGWLHGSNDAINSFTNTLTREMIHKASPTNKLTNEIANTLKGRKFRELLTFNKDFASKGIFMPHR